MVNIISMRKIVLGKMQSLYQHIAIHYPGTVNVWMFHDVLPVPGVSTYSISLDNFKMLLNYEKNIGTEFFSLTSFLGSISGASNGVLITFDDVFDSVYQNAFPILREERIPFLLFVSPALINQGPYITREHLAEMANDSLCTIAAHSTNHSMLSTLKRNESLDEIMQCNGMLTEITGKDISAFAYPYGSLSAFGIREMFFVKKLGYSCAFSTLQSSTYSWFLKSGRYMIPRWNINDDAVRKIINSNIQ